MLNSTLTATGRGICVILENYQTDTGIVVPDALQNYLGGLKFIPFVNKGEMPKGRGAKGQENEPATKDPKAKGTNEAKGATGNEEAKA